MNLKNIIPSLADISQDIAGPIPVELVEAWINSDQSDAAHEEILAPYKRSGIFVSSDSAGLSKLSAGRPLIEVMKLVSEPKEIIHAHGTAIGGRAVGVWAADNTQMFYPDSVSAEEVVSQMIGAQSAINDVLVSVGIGIHSGTAYEIGGGLYGAEADKIEDFTEEDSEANEVIVSPAIKDQLSDAFSVREERKGMLILDYENVSVDAKQSEDVFYPAPFDRAFHESLLELNLEDVAQIEALHKERVKTTSIVLFRIFHQEAPRLLDGFVTNVAANTVIHNVARQYDCQLVKSNGTLAIFSCENEGEGVDLAIALMQAAKENDLVANVGVARDEALIFDLGNGFWDLAGGPVNITSKLAEDTEERGKMFFEESVAKHAEQHGMKDWMEKKASGVIIKAIRA